MQLYALDENTPIIATAAKKEKIYFCPECKKPLKVRSGPSRQPHFYHQRTSTYCRQSAKSLEHITLQLKLLALIGESAQMEAPFPTIARIADIAWHSQKIIFEIQCSPISLEEAESRCADYKIEGYEVIWILHDKRFNQKNLSSAELYLRGVGSYFTNINKIGVGEIYDQFEVIQKHRRRLKGPRLPVNPLKVSAIPDIASPDIGLPQQVMERLMRWKYYAEGDLLHRLIQEKTLEKTAKYLVGVEEKLRSAQGNSVEKRLPLLALLARGYTALLQFLLKRCSSN